MTRMRGQNLTYGIAHELGVAIVTGVYSGDNPIPIEAELCRKYDASRPVLREAVKMLTAKGLLAARPRRGTWVQPEDKWNLLDPDVLGWLLERKYSPKLLIEFTEIRLAIEPGAAALAAQVAGPQEKAAIGAGIERMQAADRGDDDPLDSDIAFHVPGRCCGPAATASMPNWPASRPPRCASASRPRIVTRVCSSPALLITRRWRMPFSPENPRRRARPCAS